MGLENGRQVVVRNYDAIEIARSEIARSDEWTTRLLLKTENNPTKSITWTYITHDVGWEAFGTIVLQNNNTALLRVAARIFNKSDMVLEGNVMLVSGNTYQASDPPMAGRTMMRRKIVNEDYQDPIAQQVEDLHFFDKGALSLPHHV